MRVKIMKNKIFYTLLLVLAPTAANAGFSFDKITEGAANAAKAVGNATESAVDTVGNAAGKATNAVSNSIDSTKKSLRDEATPEATRAKLDVMAEKTLARLFSEQPQSQALYDQSSGYAVFDMREASFYVVAGYGRGVAVNRESDSRIYMKMATTGAGLSFGLGGWESQLVILFQSNADFENFAKNGHDATAEAGAMVGDDKEQLSHRFNEGKATFILTKKGWKIGAKLTGSRYWPDDELN
jgi:lipid-binding SYLF domain-containing protein